MPRPKYRDRKREAKEKAKEPQAVVASGATQHEQYLKCPTCARMAKVPTLQAGPYESMTRTQHYGGSQASPTGEMKTRAGIMFWDPAQPLEPAQRALLIEKLKGGLALLESDGQDYQARPDRRPEPIEKPMSTDPSDIVHQIETSLEQAKDLTDSLLEALMELMDAEDKAGSIKRLEKTLESMSEERFSGLDEVATSIETYHDIERPGKTPEEFNQEKADAFQEIMDNLGNITLVTEE